MFKMGGSTENVGIMDGMRQNYQNGDKVNQILSDLDKRAPRADPGVYDFLQNFGLNILSSPSQGNIFQTAAVAARDPAMMLQQGRAARAAERRQIAASVLAGEREFEQKKELLGMEIEGRGNTGYAKEAMENFPNDPRSVAIEKQKILDNTPGSALGVASTIGSLFRPQGR